MELILVLALQGTAFLLLLWWPFEQAPRRKPLRTKFKLECRVVLPPAPLLTVRGNFKNGVACGLFDYLLK